MPRLTLIGGGGYLGINIISKLQADPDFDYEICVLDFQLYRGPAIVDYKKIIFIEGSFLNNDLLEKSLKNAEVVFHIAAIGTMGYTSRDCERILRVNIEGTRILLEKCRQFNVRRFVFASSVMVSFTGEPIYQISEDKPLPKKEKHMNLYSYSKAEAEKLVRNASCDEMKTCALRFRGIYGPGDPNVTRRVVNIIKRGLFVYICSKHKHEAVSHASSIDNSSKAFLLADKMLKKPSGPHGKAYNIVDAEICGAFQFWYPLVSALGMNTTTYRVPYIPTILFAQLCELFCFYILKINPILTVADLKFISIDNTYSLKNAEKDLGFIPDKGIMKQVAEYYKNEKKPDKKYHKNIFVCFFVSIIVFLFYSLI